jgi:hypothetical protein
MEPVALHGCNVTHDTQLCDLTPLRSQRPAEVEHLQEVRRSACCVHMTDSKEDAVVLSDLQNRKRGPYLATINRILIPVMSALGVGAQEAIRRLCTPGGVLWRRSVMACERAFAKSLARPRVSSVVAINKGFMMGLELRVW